jgi:predicted nucleic acid-binding Zn ribbon protein
VPERGAVGGNSGGDRGGADRPDEARPADSGPGDALTRPAVPAAGDQLTRARAALAAARTAAGPAAAQARSRARPGGRVPGETQLTEAPLGSPESGGPGGGGAAGGGPGADAAQAGGQAAGGQAAGAARPASPRAARRVRRDDPQSLGSAIDGLLDAEGWNLAAATGSVFGRWPQIVGTDLAAHTSPESLREGELTVIADSTAWATQLRLLQAQLIRRLNDELGAGMVLRVKVRGPVTVSRRPGEWRVRGSRGPRDTYG